MNSELTQTGENHRERIAALQALLDELRPQLVEAEAQMEELMAAISTFEYRVRARLESLSHRLDGLQADIDDLRRRLRQYQADWLEAEAPLPDAEQLDENLRFDESAASAGSYRYRTAADTPRPAPEGKRLISLKQLYRGLARRFHPDLALDEADRGRS